MERDKIVGGLPLTQETIVNRIEKIKRNCQRMRSLITLLLVVYCVSCAVVLIGTILLQGPVGLSIITKDPISHFSVHGLDVVSTAEKSYDILKNALTTILLLEVIPSGAYIWGFVLLRQLFRSAGEGETPFSIEQGKRVKKMGLILLLSEPVSMTIAMLALKAVGAVMYPYLDMVYMQNIPFALAGLVLLCLSGMFEYGCLLQTEYDQTL